MRKVEDEGRNEEEHAQVEEGRLENIGLTFELVLAEVVTGFRNRNAEFDVEVLVELALLLMRFKGCL